MTRPRDDALVREWTDASGRRRSVSAVTREAVLAAMGGDDAAAGVDPVRLAAAGDRLAQPGQLITEDGTDLGIVDRLPADLPVGYHRVVVRGQEQLLMVAPPRCWLPDGYREWGWAVQVYATRSTRSWGIGDLADLATLSAWSARQGAGAMVISPIVAPNPGPDAEPSPYFPSSRRFRDPLLIRVEGVPGAELVPQVAELAARGRALNAERRIDRRRVRELKLQGLETIWRKGGGRQRDPHPSFASFRTEQGEALTSWATYAALREEHRCGWRSWPEPYRRPSSPAVARFAAAHEDRVAFHAWLQWLVDEQLRRVAEAGPRIVNDLPVGFDPDGFDGWCWQDLLAVTASIGAPPDEFNAAGQDWALPPFIPHRLRQARLAPFIETVRAGLRHAGGIRIDHILGLFRLWWIPHGIGPAGGAYVRYPVDELLAVLAIESARAGALVIGEDLGTVEASVRRKLRARGLLSTRLAYFERRPPAAYPRRALAAVTTHDLPTIAGAWTGTDATDQRAAGLDPDPAKLALLRRRLARFGSLAPDTSVDDAILAMHARLATSPAALVIATLEDAVRVRERPNLPGTTAAQRPNWSLALPLPLEGLVRDPYVARLAAVLSRA